MNQVISSIAGNFAETVKSRPDIYLVGVAGIPGSGKSTFCEAALNLIPGSAMVPMDGYHIPLKFLDAEKIRRRGAKHTFDSRAFVADIRNLKMNHQGDFPTFNHATKDPERNAIHIGPESRIVLVEGLYVLMKEWALESLFDFKVFIECDLDEAVQRVARRHLACGLAQTMEEAMARARGNDRVNALEILSDGGRERADLILENQ